MKKLILSAVAASAILGNTFAQVQINKPIDLSSAGANGKVTGIRDVSGATDAVSAEVIQAGKLVTAISVSGTDAILLGFTPTITNSTLQAGLMISFRAGGNNTTTSVTIDVDGVSGPIAAKPLYKNVSTNMAVNDIKNNQMVTVIYDGTNFQLLSRTEYAEVDGNVSNEGTLGVSAGSGTSSVVTTNTSGGTGVTLNAGTGLSISENASANGGDVTIGLSGAVAATNGGTGTSTVFTPGSVVFAGAGGVYAQDNSNFFWDNTNKRLGAGVSAPAARLDVSNTTAPQIIARGGGSITDDQVIGFIAGTGADYLGKVGHLGSLTGLWSLDMWTDENAPITFSTASTERMRIGGDGNVGIGTTNPGAYKLNVQAGAAYSIIQSSGDAPLQIRGTNTWSGITFADVNGAEELWYNGTSDGFAIGGGGNSVAGKKLHVHGGTTIGASYEGSTAPTNGLGVEGKLGVGTNSPTYTTQVHGGFNAGYILLGDNANNMNNTIEYVTAVGSTTYAPDGYINYYGSGSLGICSGGGNVGIGIATPGSYKLNVQGGSLQSLFQSNADAQIVLKGPNGWSGIEYADNGGTDWMWFWGATKTFTIGGGGSSGITNKKLHIHGATSIGSGYSASAQPVNSLIVEGNVGIGTINPLQALDLGSRGKNIRFGGYFYLGETQSGAASIIGNGVYVDPTVSCQVNYANSNPDGVSAIEMMYSSGISFFTKPNGANTAGTMFFDCATRTYERMRIGVDGNVTISGYAGTGSTFYVNNPTTAGTAIYANNPNGVNPNPGWAVYGNGDIYATAYYLPSDNRLKNNVADYSGALASVMKVNTKTYNYDKRKYPNAGFDGQMHYGFIAQDLEREFPTLVHEKSLPSVDSTSVFKVVDYIGMVPVLTQAIKEQQQQIEGLSAARKPEAEKSEVTALREEIELLKRRLEELEKRK